MNSGCYGEEISQYLISIKVLDLNGREIEIKKNQIDFFYRGTSLPKDLIILSARFKCKKMKKEKINEIMNNFILKRILNQAVSKLAEAHLKNLRKLKHGNSLKTQAVERFQLVKQASLKNTVIFLLMRVEQVLKI